MLNMSFQFVMRRYYLLVFSSLLPKRDNFIYYWNTLFNALAASISV